MTAKSQPIIVIKKKGGHGGHHGGAWKVAYADFVTAHDVALHRAVAHGLRANK